MIVIGNDVIGRVEMLTHQNKHTQARLLIAKRTKAERLASLYGHVGEIQVACGEIPEDVFRFRTQELDPQLREHVLKTVSNADELLGAL